MGADTNGGGLVIRYKVEGGAWGGGVQPTCAVRNHVNLIEALGGGRGRNGKKRRGRKKSNGGRGKVGGSVSTGAGNQ